MTDNREREWTVPCRTFPPASLCQLLMKVTLGFCSTTFQPSVKMNKSGDGTIPFCSLNYAETWSSEGITAVSSMSRFILLSVFLLSYCSASIKDDSLASCQTSADDDQYQVAVSNDYNSYFFSNTRFARIHNPNRGR